MPNPYQDHLEVGDMVQMLDGVLFNLLRQGVVISIQFGYLFVAWNDGQGAYYSPNNERLQRVGHMPEATLEEYVTTWTHSERK